MNYYMLKRFELGITFLKWGKLAEKYERWAKKNITNGYFETNGNNFIFSLDNSLLLHTRLSSMNLTEGSGRVSSEDEKRVHARQTRFQCEHKWWISTVPQGSEQAREQSEQAKQA